MLFKRAFAVETYEAGQRDGWDSLRDHPARHFAEVCRNILRGSYYSREAPYCAIRPEVRFAMPPVVAQVYLDYGAFPNTALPLHGCEDCGFNVPVVGGSSSTPPQRFFDVCPLCGGKVGWYAYFTKHRGDQ